MSETPHWDPRRGRHTHPQGDWDPVNILQAPPPHQLQLEPFFTWWAASPRPDAEQSSNGKRIHGIYFINGKFWDQKLFIELGARQILNPIKPQPERREVRYFNGNVRHPINNQDQTTERAPGDGWRCLKGHVSIWWRALPWRQWKLTLLSGDQVRTNKVGLKITEYQNKN